MEPRPEPRDVPALLRPDETRETWIASRRAELRDLLERQCYGLRPVERPPQLSFARIPHDPRSLEEDDAPVLGGAAFRRRMRCDYGGEYGAGSFPFTAYVPRADGPVPAFVFIALHPLEEYVGPLRTNASVWAVETLLRRGYAAIGFDIHDVTPDMWHGNTRGAFAAFCEVERLYRPRDEWGCLSVWAWGASRILDWIESEPALFDASRVAVIGHSRGGKTALLAGALDERFAMVVSNDSGTGGAKLHHVDLPGSEQIMHSVRTNQFWYCRDYTAWVNRDRETPWDQHMLVALCAPRPVCIGSASEDAWAGPWGEFCTARLASPAWELFGRRGLVGNAFPAPDAPPLQEGWISYHLRAGSHALTERDWAVYLDFADKRMA